MSQCFKKIEGRITYCPKIRLALESRSTRRVKSASKILDEVGPRIQHHHVRFWLKPLSTPLYFSDPKDLSGSIHCLKKLII